MAARKSLWRSRPVFITSTFRDMHAERDWLRTRVFPALQERLRQRFHHLDPIDLRWGVECEATTAAQEAAREVIILTVCLDEVERSRPFLIGLLGDRYGWIPSREQATVAATEAGFAGAIDGRSLTDLEIQHSIILRPDQQRRSWFYLREPLQYEAMRDEDAARYSDAHSDDAVAADKVQKLNALKANLRQLMPDRVRSYTATWDPQTRRIHGLEAWGAQVERDLWSDLEAETAAFARAAPTTWQAQDRHALDTFVETRVRNFVGRRAIATDLHGLALSPTVGGSPWGVCVTAEPGAGKSSLFGYVLRQLEEADVLVLAHAAGISVQSSQVSRMLRRWTSELAQAVGEPDPLEEHSSSDVIDRSFARLLHEAATRRRVVILIDALNQFEASPRGTYLTWLPKPWPTNVRLITTAAPGAEAQTLIDQPSGVTALSLAALDHTEAVGIVRSICARYHRVLNPRVEQALLAKIRSDGGRALGNPLWLELVVEELNLTDAETFERADAALGSRSSSERIVDLLVSMVEQMPSEVEGMYDWMLDAAERRFGAAWTKAFVHAVGVSRGGWRQSDLTILMPRLSGQAWDDLRFATLRRAFRTHAVQRGMEGQWDFAHAQLRAAVGRRLARTNGLEAAVNTTLADHLLALPVGDPLRETETMVHLMKGADLTLAAAFYGGYLTPAEAAGATAALAPIIIKEGVSPSAELLRSATELEQRRTIAERFLFDLTGAIANDASLAVRIQVAELAEKVFAAGSKTGPGPRFSFVRWMTDLLASQLSIAEMRIEQDNYFLATRAYLAATMSLALIASISISSSPECPEFDRMVDLHLKMGDLHGEFGRVHDAREAYQGGLVLADVGLARDPANVLWLKRRSSFLKRLALPPSTKGVSADPGVPKTIKAGPRPLPTTRPNTATPRSSWLVDMSGGDMYLASRDPELALITCYADLGIAQEASVADPASVTKRFEVARLKLSLGDIHIASRDQEAALKEYLESLAILRRLTTTDPSNAVWFRKLYECHVKISRVLEFQEKPAEVLEALQAAHNVLERLVIATERAASQAQGINVVDVDKQKELVDSHLELGDRFIAARRPEEAAAHHSAAVEIAYKYAKRRHVASWEPILAVCQKRLDATRQLSGHRDNDCDRNDESVARREFVGVSFGTTPQHVELAESSEATPISAYLDRVVAWYRLPIWRRWFSKRPLPPSDS